MLPRLHFGGPLLPISQASLGSERRSRHFPDDSGPRIYRDQSHLALTSRCAPRIPSTNLPSSCGLLTTAHRLRLHRGPPALWRTTLEKKNAAQEAFPSHKQGSARIDSAGLLAVWMKDQSVLMNCWGRGLPYLLLQALII